MSFIIVLFCFLCASLPQHRLSDCKITTLLSSKQKIVEKKHNYCNVGYVILYDYWGKGYASEALKVVSDYLLDSGYYLVECSCNELNKQSSRVMQKAGFKKDGYIANRRLNKDGTYSGVEYYSKHKK